VETEAGTSTPAAPPPPSLAADFGLAYEAVLSLAIALDDGGPAARYEDGEALRRRLTGLPTAVRRVLPTIESGMGLNWSDIVGLIRLAAAPRGLPELVRLLESMDPLQLKLAMLGYHDTDFRRTIGEDLFRDAAAGQAKAIRRYRLRATRSQRGVCGPLVSLPPELAVERAIFVLANLPPEFYAYEPELQNMLAKGADRARALGRIMGPLAVVERLARGLVYTPEPGIREVLMVPARVGRPWSLLLDHDSTKIFCFPVHPEPETAATPHPDLVAVYRALGDESRLRILKHLTTGRATFGELSRELGLAKSTLHHHALILRTAGLVRLHLGTIGLELNPVPPELDRLLSDFLSS
jgi:regulatory ArsR family protein